MSTKVRYSPPFQCHSRVEVETSLSSLISRKATRHALLHDVLRFIVTSLFLSDVPWSYDVPCTI